MSGLTQTPPPFGEPEPKVRVCYTCDATGLAARGWSGNLSADGVTCPDCGGDGVDKTQYGTGSDHCAHCGADWKRSHSEGCVCG
jgi:DnaJ-class molecular chaperone